MSSHQSKFARVLQMMIDDCDVLDRNQWARLLSVQPAEITAWINDRQLPSPETLTFIIDCLRDSTRPGAMKAIEAFHFIAQMPLQKATPLHTHRHFI